MKFIIYEDDKKYTAKFIKIINKYMLNKNLEYRIIIFDKYCKLLENYVINDEKEKRIYLLDVEIPKMSGIDVAREIRNYGDWNSQIILITTYGAKDYCYLTNRLLTLDFIMNSNLEKKLLLSLTTIWKIWFYNNILTFKYDGKIVNVPYDDIYYIEKNLHDNNSTIFTCDHKYIIRCSINKLTRIFGKDNRFFKTHRSCIVNIKNIVSYDINSNTIRFRNCEIDLVSRNRKKEFKNILYDMNSFY